MCAFCRVYPPTGSPAPPIIENQEQEMSYPNLSISWSSGDTSGCPVTMYTVYYKSIQRREEENTWNRISASSSTRELSALPLDCDTEYELRVSAWNELGESNPSESWKVKSITGIHINCFSHSIFAEMISKRLLPVAKFIGLNQNISNVKKASLWGLEEDRAVENSPPFDFQLKTRRLVVQSVGQMNDNTQEGGKDDSVSCLSIFTLNLSKFGRCLSCPTLCYPYNSRLTNSFYCFFWVLFVSLYIF